MRLHSLVRIACAVAVAASAAIVAVPAAAVDEIPSSEVVLHNVPTNSPFAARRVRVWIPTAAEYVVGLGITRMNGFRTVRRVARSDGQRVYVQMAKRWVAVPYSYRGPGNVLHFEESLRIVMGLPKDPLGAPRPVYIGERPAPRPPVPATARFPDSPATTALLGTAWRDQMLAAVNALRAEVGAPAARLCLPLNDSATYKAQTMATTGYYGHGTAAGTPTIGDVARGSGGQGVSGENVASGYASVAEVVAGWRNSPGHYRNMTRAMVVLMGFGSAVAVDGTVTWTQHFSMDGGC